MPIPKPKINEERKEYMQRCMNDTTMKKEYNKDQRLAICSNTFEENKKKY